MATGQRVMRDILCCLVLGLLFTRGQVLQIQSFQRVLELDNRKLFVLPEQRMTKLTLLTCFRRCLAAESCLTLFHQPSTGECLLAKYVSTHSNATVYAPGFQCWRDLCPERLGYEHITRNSISLCVRFNIMASVDYNTAKASCVADGGDLINLNTLGKFYALRDYAVANLNTYGKRLRIDGIRPTNGTLRDFRQASGQPLPFSDPALWKIGEPDTGKNVYAQDCLALSADGFLLLDCYCGNTDKGYICEFVGANVE